jgi:hypothetical protein
MNEVDAAVARGECWACGECVPWICPNCLNQRCNWFDEKCGDCGTLRRDAKTDPRALARLRQELSALRKSIDESG